jgi:murein DD-endopeptidase MepM/ murein hydrolase activator NlpD
MAPLARILPVALLCALLASAPANATWDAPLQRTALMSAFPLNSAYDFGTSANGFGGGRGHDGQDVFAPCGAPIVAALGGEVTRATYEGAAGNYVVVTSADGGSQVYMHLRRAAPVAEGDDVYAGQKIGEVGATGDADGCHLHFELWTAPGWYAGGVAVDPIGTLRRWAVRR